MYLQGYSNDDFWKADAHQSFPSLKNGHMDEAEAHQLPRVECSFYSVEMCRTASYGWGIASNTQALFPKGLYRVLVTWAATGDLIDKFGLTKQELHSIWPWSPGLKCLINTEVSLTWLIIWEVLWVGKKNFVWQSW